MGVVHQALAAVAGKAEPFWGNAPPDGGRRRRHATKARARKAEPVLGDADLGSDVARATCQHGSPEQARGGKAEPVLGDADLPREAAPEGRRSDTKASPPFVVTGQGHKGMRNAPRLYPWLIMHPNPLAPPLSHP